MSSLGKIPLGPYEILEQIGAGGMGEVYRARDTRLERIVAIKVISEELSRDPIARERFQREVRAASAINHRHICTIYDVGEWQGRPFLAMEYLEGESLRRRLETKPLDLEELIRFGIEIAEALQAAHEHGIVHRDVKPGNIFVTSTGHVKVVDFGLAKRVLRKDKVKAVGARFNSTVTASEDLLTSPGSITGTAAYMSPEQQIGSSVHILSSRLRYAR